MMIFRTVSFFLVGTVNLRSECESIREHIFVRVLYTWSLFSVRLWYCFTLFRSHKILQRIRYCFSSSDAEVVLWFVGENRIVFVNDTEIVNVKIGVTSVRRDTYSE